MTLLFNYENSRIYFFVLWTIPLVPISHRISMRMFSYITLCKYTYHSSICLLAIILSIQSFQSSYNHTGYVLSSPVRIVYHIWVCLPHTHTHTLYCTVFGYVVDRIHVALRSYSVLDILLPPIIIIMRQCSQAFKLVNACRVYLVEVCLTCC